MTTTKLQRISYEGVPTKYLISEYGEVYSEWVGRFMNLGPNTNGYVKVKMVLQDRTSVQIYLHRLMMHIFRPDLPMSESVNHIDGNKLNNNINNLEWATMKQQYSHAKDLGLMGKQTGLIKVELTKGEEVLKFPSISAASRHLGVSTNAVAAVTYGWMTNIRGYKVNVL